METHGNTWKHMETHGNGKWNRLVLRPKSPKLSLFPNTLTLKKLEQIGRKAGQDAPSSICSPTL